MLPTLLSVAALVIALVLGVVQHRRHRALRRRIERVRVSANLTHNLLAAAWAELASQRPTRFACEFRAQHGEDMFIAAMFPGVRDGFFIEAGAFDGYFYANTYALEAMGWRGLLVEPLPDRAEQARACRPGSRVVQAALSSPGAPDTLPLRRGAPGRHSHELCSGLADGEAATAGGRRGEGDASIVHVPVRTLDALLAEGGGSGPGGTGHRGPIHAVVLDVEGHEVSAFQGFDLDRYRPKLLIVEDMAGGGDTPVAVHLHARGYRTAGFIAYNRILARADEPAVLDRARLLLHQADRGEDQPGSPPVHAGHPMHSEHPA